MPHISSMAENPNLLPDMQYVNQIILDFLRLDLLTSAYHTTAQTQQMTDDDHNGGGV